jgi:hypothetical protein
MIRPSRHGRTRGGGLTGNRQRMVNCEPREKGPEIVRRHVVASAARQSDLRTGNWQLYPTAEDAGGRRGQLYLAEESAKRRKNVAQPPSAGDIRNAERPGTANHANHAKKVRRSSADVADYADSTFVIPAQAGIQSPETTKSRRTRRRAQGEGNRG